MFSLHLHLINPWYTENFENLFNRSGLLSKHKAWEFEVYRYSYDVAKIYFKWSARTDHAGPKAEISLAGYTVSFQIYDTRHWDTETGNWEVHVEND